MARANTVRSRSVWFQVLLCVLDGLFIALLLVTAFFWVSDQLRFRKLLIGAVAWVSDALGSGVFRAPRFLASWEAGLLMLFGELLALRYLVVRWARHRSVKSRGLLAVAAIRNGLMLFLVVFAFFLLFESVLLLIGFEAPLPPLVMQGVEHQESHDEDEASMASLRAGLVTQIMCGLRKKRFYQLMTLLLSPSNRTPNRASGDQVRQSGDSLLARDHPAIIARSYSSGYPPVRPRH